MNHQIVTMIVSLAAAVFLSTIAFARPGKKSARKMGPAKKAGDKKVGAKAKSAKRARPKAKGAQKASLKAESKSVKKAISKQGRAKKASPKTVKKASPKDARAKKATGVKTARTRRIATEKAELKGTTRALPKGPFKGGGETSREIDVGFGDGLGGAGPESDSRQPDRGEASAGPGDEEKEPYDPYGFYNQE
jgi:hypothetical protein